MAQVIVTVNSKPVDQYLAKEKSREVEQFLRDELRSMGRMSRGRLCSTNSTRQHEYRRAAPKPQVVYA